MMSRLRQAKVRGRLQFDAPLGPRSWFRTGGNAEALFTPADREDLAQLLRQLDPRIPVTVLGACSNVIIRDGGIKGLVIRLGGAFAQVMRQADEVIAGAAALDTTVSEQAAAWGLSGLEFMIGIPGAIGGAVIMNAGAHGSDTSKVLSWAEIMDRRGHIQRLSHADLKFSYRHATLPEGAIVLRVALRGKPAEPAKIRAHMAEIKAQRDESQPVRARTGGSTFRNPTGQKAWALIDAAGCRGLRHGGAQVSEKHCNFLLNLGDATSADLEALGETVRQKVQNHAQVQLEWEIKRLGETR